MPTRQPTNEPDLPEVVLITGFPRFLARRLAHEILERDPDAQLVLLVSAAQEPVAAALATDEGRVRLLAGDVSAMDLGLSGTEYKDLCDSVTTIHHMETASLREDSREVAERIHVEGTRGILQLALDCRHLRRLCHWSSVTVAGRRKGVVLEEDLDEHQSFHNAHEQTLFAGEKLVRAAMANLPITVFRPGIVVCDSKTGECDEHGGPYHLLAMLAGGHKLPVPIPSPASAPLHLVPADFVAAAGYVLSRDHRATSRTFHLTDPNPLPARKVFELVAELAHAKLAKHGLPTGIAKTLLRAPGLERLARAPRAFLDSLDQQVFFNSRLAAELLAEHGIRCPSFDHYASELVRFVRAKQGQDEPTAEADDEPADPFE